MMGWYSVWRLFTFSIFFYFEKEWNPHFDIGVPYALWIEVLVIAFFAWLVDVLHLNLDKRS